jgi:CD109 antigen
MDIFKFVRVQVKVTEPIKYIYYQVIGKGGVLASHRKNLPNSKVFVFRFWATFPMVPEAVLVIYYYRPDGEIIADRVTLKFENRLDNYVGKTFTYYMKFISNYFLTNQADIKLSATQLEPGKSVGITVDSKCNSYIGLLGIDQSVKLLKSGEKFLSI